MIKWTASGAVEQPNMVQVRVQRKGLQLVAVGTSSLRSRT